MLAFRKEPGLMHNSASGKRDARMRRDGSRSIRGNSARLLPGSPKLDSCLVNDSLAMVSRYLFERAGFLSEARNGRYARLAEAIRHSKTLGRTDA